MFRNIQLLLDDNSELNFFQCHDSVGQFFKFGLKQTYTKKQFQSIVNNLYSKQAFYVLMNRLVLCENTISITELMKIVHQTLACGTSLSFKIKIGL